MNKYIVEKAKMLKKKYNEADDNMALACLCYEMADLCDDILDNEDSDDN